MRVVGFVVALICLAAFSVGFGIFAEKLTADLNGEIALSILGLVATTWFAIWSFNKTKRRESEALLFPNKAEVYKKIVDIIRDLTFAQKGWIDEIDQNVLAQRFSEARFDMIIWGGQDTIRALGRLEDAGEEGPAGLFQASANLYHCLRKELGHSDDDQLAKDLIAAQVISEDRDKIRDLLK